MEALFMDLASAHPSYETEHVEWGYADVMGGCSSVPFVASRLGLPPRAAFVDLSAHLDPEFREAFRHPDLEELPEDAPPLGFFRVEMSGGQPPAACCAAGWEPFWGGTARLCISLRGRLR